MIAIPVWYKVRPAFSTRARRHNPIISFWRRLLDPYRPELHYMRGPGPKWCARHLHKTAP
jgi:hypothetical protein